MAWVNGRHQFKFGGSFRYRRMTVQDRRNEGGTFNFNALSTSQPNSTDFARFGNPFASFLLGEVYSASAAVPAPTRQYNDQFLAVYFEDVFKVSSRLTLSLGLRYELPFYVREREGIISFLDPTRPNPAAGNRPGGLGVPRRRTGQDGKQRNYSRLQPRLLAASCHHVFARSEDRDPHGLWDLPRGNRRGPHEQLPVLVLRLRSAAVLHKHRLRNHFRLPARQRLSHQSRFAAGL